MKLKKGKKEMGLDNPLWGFELGDDCSAVIQSKSNSKALKTINQDVVNAPGYITGYTNPAELNKKLTSAEEDKMHQQIIGLRTKRMMAVGQAPGKQLFMTGFMLWMSGSGINIFSIMMTGMALSNPVKSLFSINKVFEQFEGLDGLLRAKLMFVALNGVGLTFAMYKLALMGLLPLKSGDWISLLEVKHTEEILGGSLSI